MGVVRRYALPVTRRTNGKQFLAIVPYASLTQHVPPARAGAGAGCTLEMDNTIRCAVGATAKGQPLRLTRGPLSDAEMMLAFHTARTRLPASPPRAATATEAQTLRERQHMQQLRVNGTCTGGWRCWMQVPEEWEGNPDASVGVRLPGVGKDLSDILKVVDAMRLWRRWMRLPPRGSDLWRNANLLHLFGEDDDEAGLLSAQNRALLNVGAAPTPRYARHERATCRDTRDTCAKRLRFVRDTRDTRRGARRGRRRPCAAEAGLLSAAAAAAQARTT